MSNKELLTYKDLIHPLLRNRIVLDYPLDLLLNRECSLQDYENGIIPILHKYNTEKNIFWSIYNKKETDKQLQIVKDLSLIISFYNYPFKDIDLDNIFTSKLRTRFNTTLEPYRSITITDKDEYIKKVDSSCSLLKADLTNVINETIPDLIEKISPSLETRYNSNNDQIATMKFFKSSIDEIGSSTCIIHKIQTIVNNWFNDFLDSFTLRADNNISENQLDNLLKNFKHKISLTRNNLFTENTFNDLFAIFYKKISEHINVDNNILISRFTTALFFPYNVIRGKVGSLIVRTASENVIFDDINNSKQIGSGNILIKGRPGSGKSTLALQMAVACTSSPNHYSSIYISLEESITNTKLKARSFSWDDKLKVMAFLSDIDDTTSSQAIGDSLINMITQPGDCPLLNSNSDNESMHDHNKSLCEPFVYLPLLSPRSISHENSSNDTLFWERFRQIERLLSGIEYLRECKDKYISSGFNFENIPDIRMVCIDSLNVFGERPLSRTELYSLFDLFKSKGVIGVFTAEQDSELTDAPVGEKIEDYLADIIIQMHMEDDAGYAGRYLEIRKSRYQHQIYGLHPLRLRGLETQNQFRQPWTDIESVASKLLKKYNRDSKEIMFEDFRQILTETNSDKNLPEVPDEFIEKYRNSINFLNYSSMIYNKNLSENIVQKTLKARNHFFQPITVQPSLHFIVSQTEMQSLSQRGNEENTFSIGNNNLSSYLKKNMGAGSIVTVKGPRSTFKTNIARNFLLDGISKNENVLLITFNERSSVKLENEKICWKLLCDEMNSTEDNNIRTNLLTDIFSRKNFSEIKAFSLNDPKRIMKIYEFQTDKKPRLIELALKSGALIPEEFMEFVRDILREYRENCISRVVLDDVALISQSYPFLKHSKTSGDLFLPAFTHLMKNYNINTLINGTTGQTLESDEVVNRACELADSVLTTDFCDVFGDRYVIVTGDGMHSMSSGPGENDFVPAVIRLIKNPKPKSEQTVFEVNTKLLQGLVGFGTPHIYRPGLRLYTFKEGSVLNAYNRELQAMLSSSLGISWQESFDDEQKPEHNRTGIIAHSPLKNQDISVVTFDSSMTSALHDSLDILQNKPIDSTVVYTVDEFWLCKDSKKESNVENAFHSLPPKLKKGHKCDHTIGSVVPYYNNVLLIAFRKDLGKYFNLTKDCFKSWKSISNTINKLNSNKLGNIHLKPCSIDTSAQETIACILANAFTCKGRHNNIYEITLGQDNYNLNLIKNIQYILYQASLSQDKRNNKTKSIQAETLPDNAAFYICWYTQLRELTRKNPELAGKLSVCGLPRYSIKGDWYLGVAKGSVSIDLGMRVIEILNSEHEQYKRFCQGIGLPTLNKFYDAGFPTTSKDNIPDIFNLEKIATIHESAISRIEIKNYKQARLALYTIGDLLINKDFYNKNNGDVYYDELNTLFKERLNVLTNSVIAK